jgi:hypothetical protein
MLRLGGFSKDAVDDHNLNASITWQVHDDSLRIYMTEAVADNSYVMCETTHFVFPMALEAMEKFLALTNLDNLINVGYLAKKICIKRATSAAPLPYRETLDSPNFRAYMNNTRDCNRPTGVRF